MVQRSPNTNGSSAFLAGERRNIHSFRTTDVGKCDSGLLLALFSSSGRVARIIGAMPLGNLL